jgi:hypothetical protein
MRINQHTDFFNRRLETKLKELNFEYDFESLTYMFNSKELVAEAKLYKHKLEVFFVPLSLEIDDHTKSYLHRDYTDESQIISTLINDMDILILSVRDETIRRKQLNDNKRRKSN